MTCSIPKTNPNHTKKTKSWWNEECKQAITDKTNALKKLDLTLSKKACAISRKIINNAKRKDLGKIM